MIKETEDSGDDTEIIVSGTETPKTPGEWGWYSTVIWRPLVSNEKTLSIEFFHNQTSNIEQNIYVHIHWDIVK